VLFDRHEDRLLAGEDLIGGDLAGAGTAEGVEDGQRGSGTAAGSLGATAQSGQRGRGLAEQDGEQGVGGTEADALGLGGGHELVEAVVVQEDGLAQLVPSVGEVTLQLGDAAVELVALLLGLGVIQGMCDGMGLSVEGLPGAEAEGGEVGDGTVGAEKDGVSTGDTVGGG